MAKSITKNYIYNLSYQLLTLITPFITIPYLSRVLGPDGIGEYSFTFSVVTYFVLVANLGVSNYAQREIAYHQDDRLTQSRIFYEVNVLRLFLVSVNLIFHDFVMASFPYNLLATSTQYSCRSLWHFLAFPGVRRIWEDSSS